ncbi:RdgB/HAM1 family non-canonical purine NTP pyrophosphatase [Legionella micdadei]|uniref:dITP/XTP pyrophosphatase n=1 Tax=Legionella micdadei TaxID=451 RepID=A0A098GDD0_LEGMI|nr:RdgB/HAM1 family non-canonical purine NTP pyrophosphatase [Legionella micdadei]ARG98349.1 non-canonical purine NTP pyrophosphatase [Legionella micdadei]ARH01102.1 non-canonical purine NTP pyrophosphatase [Legionella micdadei]KTD27282.1 deoxyribonucleotide triphosphate pyrophosphatase [Legionella micdadei]NSL18666.1 RdgB/HAM1 family non-canonical purine NTP pyrophosphatase [Legionella micdadei]CEG59977.1 Nucleoside-triphosphatase [Legionella micdadei]
MREIILATSNKGKIAELGAILSHWHCIPQTNLGIKDAEETGLSFVENAIIKARHASRLGHKPALADDSGLVVQALNGAPGIYSARYAGNHASDHDNINLLLGNLAAIPNSQRQAFFYCAIALVMHAEDPTPLIATGRLTGTICQTPRGDQGFGYDPIFYIESQQCTVAQLPAKIKNSISHRAQALNQLRRQLETEL